MWHSKYLDDLGIPVEEQGVNFLSEDDPRKYRDVEEYGFSEAECWGLDEIMTEWIYIHLMKYREDAGQVVNLDFYKFDFQEKEYTQREAIDYILEGLKNSLTFEKDNPNTGDFEAYNKKYGEMYQRKQDAFRMLAEILPVLWW